MNHHVIRNKHKLTKNHLTISIYHVIVVVVQVIIHQSVMQELTRMEMTWSKNGF
jgi:hypothetical protein